MNKHTPTRHPFHLLLAVVLLCALLVPPGAQAADPTSSPRTVRVAVADTPYLSQKQPDGSYRGILIDYLAELSKYAGWQVEYVEGPIGTLLEQLADGEVDLMGGMFQNADSAALYDFPAYSSGSSFGVLLSKESRSELVPGDYTSLNGIRVGIYRKAASRIADFDAFCQTNGLSFQRVLFDNSAEMRQALNEGTVDAILSNDTTCRQGDTILARFAETPYYFAVTRGDLPLLQELNTALATLRQVSPQFDESVYQKHLLSQQDALLFTAAERSFIRQHAPLRVAVVAGLAPSQDWDSKANAPAGIFPDILALVSQHSGLQFTYLPVKTLTEARQLLDAGEADLTLRPCGSSVGETGVVRTATYLDSQMIRIYHLNPHKSGVGKTALLEGYHALSGSPDSVRVYSTLAECVQALSSGQVESLTISALLLENYPDLKANKRLFLSPVPNTIESASLRLRSPANPLLISILDKTICSLTTEDVQEIVHRRTVNQSFAPSFLALLQIYPTETAWVVAGIFFITASAALLLLLLNRARLKLIEESSLQDESYRIVGALSGEQIFFYDFHRHKLTLPQSFAATLGIDRIQHARPGRTLPQPVPTLLELLQRTDCQESDGGTAEFSCPLVNGTSGWFRAVATVLPDADGKPLRGIGGLRSIQKEVSHLQRLEKQANTDYLTELCNRQYCEQLIQAGVDASGCGALFIMDVDYFKRINDSMGHVAGDLILKEFAGLLRQRFSSQDVVGRWGGDEFIAFVRGPVDRSAIAKQAQLLCQAMNQPFSYQGITATLSISVGVAVVEAGASYQELFLKADQALYQVKSTTRNGFSLV